MKAKKPDNVVYNDKEDRYDAFLRPYPTDLGAPVIQGANLSPWKNSNIRKVNQAINAEFEELQQQYAKLMEKFEYNRLIYSSKFNFQPVVGEVYHLYNNRGSQAFLSILSPEECGFDYIGSFRLGSDHQWEKLD